MVTITSEGGNGGVIYRFSGPLSSKSEHETIVMLVVLALGFAGYGVRERKSRMRRRHCNLG